MTRDTPQGSQHWDAQIDAMGLLCPLPVLKARKSLLAMDVGQVLCVLATDPAAVIDMPHFCNDSGHTLLGMEPYAVPEGTQLSNAQAYFIRRG